MFEFSPASGERFYNMPDKTIWFERLVLQPTEEQKPSVTTILSVWPKSREFYEWMASQDNLRAAEAVRDDGGKRGRIVHDHCEGLLRGEKYSFKSFTDLHHNGDHERAYFREWRRIEAFASWHASLGNPRPVARRSGELAIETKLYSWKWGYGGTTDCILTGGEFGARRILIDYKTSKGIYDSFWAQLFAYFYAWHEMGEEPLDGVGILHLGSTAEEGYTFKIMGKEQAEAWFLDFLAAYQIWKRVNKNKQQRDVYQVREQLQLEREREIPVRKPATSIHLR